MSTNVVYPAAEVANLRTTAALFHAPRLRQLAEVTRSHPSDTTHRGWQEELRQMAHGLDLLLADEISPVETEVRDRALALLGRRLPDLWS